MSTVQTGDQIAVYRSGKLYKAPADMSTLHDTDIIVVGRGNTPYKCTFLDWKNSQKKPPFIGGATLADSPEGGRFTSGTFKTTLTGYDAGNPAATVGVKAWVEGTLKSNPVTSAITNVSTTEKWSARGDISVPDLFNGKVSGDGGGLNRATVTFTPPITAKTSIAIYATDTTTLKGAGNFVVNGKTYTGGEGNKVARVPIAETSITTLQAVYVHRGNNTIVLGIEVDGELLVDNLTVLTLATADSLARFAIGDVVTEVGNGNDATGTVGFVDSSARTIKLSDTAGTWNVGSQVRGPLQTISNLKLFCKLDATLHVTDLQSADPGYTAVTGPGPYKLTWPATLPTGDPPDTDLPAGTQLTTEVQATNSYGVVTKTSNTVTPA